jgi:hypothetical protein
MTGFVAMHSRIHCTPGLLSLARTLKEYSDAKGNRLII